MNVLYVRNALYVGLSVIQLFTPRLFISLATLADIGTSSLRFFTCFYSIFLYLPRYISSSVSGILLKKYREHGGNSRTVILIGSNKNMTELYQEMTGDPTTGFRITGYFCDVPSDDFPERCPLFRAA